MSKKETIQAIFKILKQRDYADHLKILPPAISSLIKKEPSQKTCDSVEKFLSEQIRRLIDLNFELRYSKE